ncbi:MAG: tetratricopeptide repeat protein [Acidobacteriota bacterium]
MSLPRKSRPWRSTGAVSAVAIMAVVILALAPAAAATGTLALDEDTLSRLRQARVDPATITAPMAIEPAMKAWAEERVQRGAPDPVRLKRLLRELYEADDLNFEYQEGYTATVAETFATGRYNCLSFSMLYVALARSLGLEAFYLSIQRDQDFRRVGDLVVLTRHITAGYGSNFVDRTILEFDVGPDVDYAAAEPITDREALALFYSNRGAELLREEKFDAAEENLRTAVLLAPEIAQTWVNLGVVYRRVDRFDEAREAYEKAISLERDNVAAYQNLVILLRRQGKDDAAAELIDVLDNFGNRNPFTFLALGDFSLEDGKLTEAGRFYRKAHRLARYEAETHAAMGLWSMLIGKHDRARRWMRSAQDLDPENARTRRLAARLEARGL